jgi:hypothetical protein
MQQVLEIVSLSTPASQYEHISIDTPSAINNDSAEATGQVYTSETKNAHA